MAYELPFELASDAYQGELRPLEVFVREEVNAPYRIEARVSAPVGEAVAIADAFFEARATVLLPTPLGPRKFHGLVADTQILGEDAFGGVAVEVSLVPHVELLRHKKQARIFQHKTTCEILSVVVREVGQRVELRVANALDQRVYCCQYHESDLSFFERLLMEDGLFYWFEHEGDEETLIIADSANAYRPIAGDPALRFRGAGADDAMMLDERHVTALTGRTSLRTKGTVRRDFDITRPRLPLVASHGLAGLASRLAPAAEREIVRGNLSHDVHLGSREEARVLGVPPERYTEGLRATSTLYTGASVCRRLAVGHTFQVEGDARGMANDLVAWSVMLHARTSALAEGGVTYEATFQGVPADVPMRPLPRSLKPTATSETAIVVGPTPDDIHTDELGRVKVQFHWDRDGGYDDHSSCWLRVQQPWSGPSFGAQFLPRVGTEVTVGFIAGDPDRPIITGSLYNAASPFPFSLPEDREKAGFRSQSIGPGDGGGCHELVFDDTRGQEMLSLRSQNALRVTSVGPSLVEVGTDAERRVGGAVNEVVGGDATTQIAGASQTQVAGSVSASVGGPARCSLSKDAELTISGSATHTIGKNLQSFVSGFRSTVIGGNPNEPSLDTTSVHGSSRIGASEEITLTAGRAIALRCGKSTIRLLPDRIVLDTDILELQGKKHLSAVQGPEGGVSWALDGDFVISAGIVSLAAKDGGTLLLNADASLDGTFVRLNCGSDSVPAKNRGQQGLPVARVTFRLLPDGLPAGTTEATLVISGPGGKTLERTCAVGGEVTIEGEPGDPYRLVEVRVGGQVIDVTRVDTSRDDGGSHV